MITSRQELARTIGKHARAARKALNLTQEQVAEAVGVCVEFYARVERGKALPGLMTLIALARVLGIGADRLLGLAAQEL